MAEGDKSAPLRNLPDPFPGFGRIGPRDSNEQEQIPLPPSPDGHDDEEEEVAGEIAVEVEVEGKGEEEEEEEEDINPWSSEEPSSLSGYASNSLSSLGQPIPSHCPFALCHQARGGSTSSTGPPPFASSHAGKGTSTRKSHETRSAGNIETASSSPSGGSPTLAASPTSSVPSTQDVARDMPMPPCHPAAGRQRVNAPRRHQALSPLHQRAVLRPHGHDKHSRGTVSSCIRASDWKSYTGLTARTTAHPAWDSLRPMGHRSLEARGREDSVGLPSLPSSQPSPRASLHGSCNGGSTSLARISGAFHPRSHSRNTSLGSTLSLRRRREFALMMPCPTLTTLLELQTTMQHTPGSGPMGLRSNNTTGCCECLNQATTG
jgi:hypothetical protein